MEIQFKRRAFISHKTSFYALSLSILTAVVFCSIVLLVSGLNPIMTYGAILEGAIGNPVLWIKGDFYNFSEVLVKAIPLAICGLGISIAFRISFWNIGAEGQLALGGVAASGFALFAAPFVPSFLVIPLMFIMSAFASALWAVIPAYLKIYLSINEVVSNLMMNYISLFLVDFLIYGPWKDPNGYGLPGTSEFLEVSWLPRFSGTRVHFGLIILLFITIGVELMLSYTKWGYEFSVIGENPKAANLAGINVKNGILFSVLLSGSLIGIAGMMEVSAIAHRLNRGFTVGYGFTSIIVAWLAGLSPYKILLTSVFLSILLVGSDQLQITMRLPSSIGEVFQGIFLLCVVSTEFFKRYKIICVFNQK